MSYNLPPIPQDKIEENPRWREWFRNLGRYIQDSQLGSLIISIAQGGTGASTASGARHNLGLGTMAVQNSNNIQVSGGTVTNTDIYFSCGAFRANATQSVATINTPTKVTFDTTDYAFQMSYSSGKINVQRKGLYKILFSSQITNADNTAHDLDIWVRKGNGVGSATDVPNTACVTSVVGTHGGQPGYGVISASFYIDLIVDDYIEFWWATNSTDVTLQYLPAITTPFASPAASSIVATLTYVSAYT